MSYLYTSDVACTGVWRALIVKPLDDGRAHVYIPSLHSGLMPFTDPSDPSGGVVSGCEGNYPVANGIWWKCRTEIKVGDPVWVAFENGDINFPIITGMFGTAVPLASEFNGSVAGVQGSASFGDSNVVDMSGQLTEHGKISKVENLVLHTSGCNTVQQLINALNADPDKLGVQAAADDKAIYKLCSSWDALMYHCQGINGKAIGCEMLESEHVKWDSNMTYIPDEDYFKAHINEIIAWHDKCYNNAVNLFAYWCITFGLDTSAIVSHKESPKVGGTSDHADPEELWDYFVKYTGNNKWTMDAFRQAVKDRIPTLRISEGGSAGGFSKYIFVGDSRTCGMYAAMCGDYSSSIDKADPKNPSDYYIAKVSMGYSWFVSSDIQSKIKSQISANSALVVLMGCNGVGNTGEATKYATFMKNKYSEWTASGASVFFVSVNPVDDSAAKRSGYAETDSMVVNFNNEIKSQLGSIKYIDTYSKIKSSFKASDGLHYDNNTYKNIYNIIKGQ